VVIHAPAAIKRICMKGGDDHANQDTPKRRRRFAAGGRRGLEARGARLPLERIQVGRACRCACQADTGRRTERKARPSQPAERSLIPASRWTAGGYRMIKS